VHGFTIEDPAVVVPWRIGEGELRSLLPSAREVAPGYLVADVVSLGGLRHSLGFHFEPRIDGRLTEFELFRLPADDVAKSFWLFDRHLRDTFGPPNFSRPGDEGLPTDRWVSVGAELTHFVFDRFGPEEHVRIRRGRRRAAVPRDIERR
jgi:hypothetical protein